MSNAWSFSVIAPVSTHHITPLQTRTKSTRHRQVSFVQTGVIVVIPADPALHRVTGLAPAAGCASLRALQRQVTLSAEMAGNAP